MQRGAFAQMNFVTAPAAGKVNHQKRCAFVEVTHIAVESPLLAIPPWQTTFNLGMKIWDWRADFQPWWLAGCDPLRSFELMMTGHLLRQSGGWPEPSVKSQRLYVSAKPGAQEHRSMSPVHGYSSAFNWQCPIWTLLAQIRRRSACPTKGQARSSRLSLSGRMRRSLNRLCSNIAGST